MLWGHGGCPAHVGVIRLVEGEYPGRRVRSIDEIHCGGHVACEGHHGDVIAGCARRGATARGDGELEGEPGGGGSHLVVHRGLHAAVKDNSFQVATTTDKRTCGSFRDCHAIELAGLSNGRARTLAVGAHTCEGGLCRVNVSGIDCGSRSYCNCARWTVGSRVLDFITKMLLYRRKTDHLIWVLADIATLYGKDQEEKLNKQTHN